jgi:hypothetical protein
VARGQTLDRIAQLYHVSKDQIIAANQLKPPYTLPPGTMLTIPVAALQSTKPAKSKASAAVPAAAKTTGESAPVRHKKPKEAEPEVIPLDDVPTHSLPMPKSGASSGSKE